MVRKKTRLFAETVDEYMEGLPTHARSGAERLRRAIRKAAPKAIELISYQMPAYKLNGKFLVSFAVWKKHFGLYPIPAGDAVFRKKAEQYRGARSTLRFPIEKPIPLELILRTVRFRIKENSASERTKAPRWKRRKESE